MEIKKLNSTERGEKFERHCPGEGKRLNCVVPMPKGYQIRIPWPQSRDEVWFSNVPHTRLVEDKGGQNWISIKGDKFVFPGGGTQFIHGADQYLDQISQMIPEMSQAFDMIHCSRCRINWTRDDGIWLLEVNRLLRAGGYFVWAAQPVYKHEEALQVQWKGSSSCNVYVFLKSRYSLKCQELIFSW